MTRFARPNPDAWSVVNTAFAHTTPSGELRLEIWERNSGDARHWIMVVDDGTKESHAPLADETFAVLMRVLTAPDEGNGE